MSQTRVVTSRVGAIGGAYAVSSFLNVSISNLPNIEHAKILILCAALLPTAWAERINPVFLSIVSLINIGLPPG